MHSRILRLVALLVGALIAFVLIYLLAAFGLSRVAVPAEPNQSPDVTAYILSNGVHTDIVVPVRTTQIDWSRVVPFINTMGSDSTASWVGFGWGDKGFYLETPTWGDLTARVACNAMFGLGTTAMHATYHDELTEGAECKRLAMSNAQYARLVEYIRQGFAYDAEGRTIHVGAQANYGTTDAFYDGAGTYSLFHTCNTWSNDALKSCGQKACWWTPFDTGIFLLYEE